MNLYEFNQAGYNSLPKMTSVEIHKKLEQIKEFLHDNDGEYFMLVCNELKYYTLFHSTHVDWIRELIQEMIGVVKSLGTLKAIEINDSMIEFWVEKNGECHMYAFFNYDRGVIEV